LKAGPKTLRKEFGTTVEHNALHGSDSLENAQREIAFFFTENQIYPRK
jgi:nucleoside-diphosphate kinase